MAKQTKTSTEESKKTVQPGKAQVAAKPEAKTMGTRVSELREFFEQSKGELKKVVWPTRKEVTATAIAVLIVVVLMGIFLGVADTLLSKLIQVVLS